jgi:integrase
MSLTDTTVRNAKPREKQYRLADGKGLCLLVRPCGGKYWRFRYRYADKEKEISLGVYPEITLKEARDSCDEKRALIRNGKDPSQERQETKIKLILDTTNSFEQVSREWHENQLPGWTPRHAGYVLRRLEADIFPALGNKPINQITAPELLAVLREIEKRGVTDIANRVLNSCGQVFRYAIATSRADRDISADLRGALKITKKVHHARLEAKELPEFLQKVENYDGDIVTKLAIKLLVLTFVRTGELRGARWEEFDFTKKEWKIPGHRMKMRDPHIVFLSKQTLEIIEQLKPITGHREHLFPNKNRPLSFMSENTILYALYRMGYHSRATGHGFRATASTILNEHRFHPDVIERALAHVERNNVRAAYNHAQYLDEREKMMQWWADYIDEAAGRGEVIIGEFGKAKGKA